MRRADPPPKPARARFEIDRAWWWRGALVVVIIGFLLVLTKASTMLFGSGNKRVERQERATERPAAAQPATPPKPAPSR